MVSAWDWRPTAHAWCLAIGDAMAVWSPHVRADVDQAAVRARLCAAAASGEEWLYHPCLSAITCMGSRAAERDLQLLAWVAAHGGPSDGMVYVEAGTSIWAPSGGAYLQPGKYPLSRLAAVVGAKTPWPLALDGRSLAAHADIGDERPDDAGTDSDAIARNARLFFRTLTAAQRFLAPTVEWVTGATKVVVPLPGRSNTWRSGSASDLPGLIWLDILGSLQILESIVHESAHQYFFLAEASGELADSSHEERYPSPFRSDLRPLRSVLLAYHALAHICRMYCDAFSAGFQPDVASSALEERLGRLRDTAHVLTGARQHLTSHGDEFLARTMKVADSVV